MGNFYLSAYTFLLVKEEYFSYNSSRKEFVTMLIIQGIQVTVEALLDAVSKLSPTEQARFERGLKAMRQQRVSLKEKVSRCAESYKFPTKQQKRLRELLEKNKERLLRPEEEKELDTLLEELDRRNLLLADEIFSLAHQQKNSAGRNKRGEIS